MAGLKFLYNLILKDAARGSGSASGILSIGKDVRKLADKKFQRYITTAKKQGVDLDKLSEEEIKYMMELNKPKAPQVLSNEEAFEFLNQFLNQGKKGEVIRGKFKPLITVDSVITDIKKLEPMDSLKETNKVLRGDGKYKNLSKADREKIAHDESVTDHIFERNIKYDADGEEIIDWDAVDDIDPEDFAGGGLAGMLGEPTYQDEEHRVPYKDGKTGFSGTFDEWRAQNPSRKELLSEVPSKNIGDFIGPIPQYDEKGDLIPIFSKTGKQQIKGAPEGITSDKEFFNLIVGLDIPITEKIKILGNIGFSKFRDRIEKDDQELFLIDPASNVDKNIGIGYEDDGLSGSFTYNPYTKHKQFQISKKFNEGGRVPYQDGKLVKEGSSSSQVLPYDFDELDHDELMHIIKLLQAGEIPKFADGGRIGFSEGKGPKMSRRNFLKIMGGLAALPVVGKFFKFAKPAAKVANVASVPIKNIEGMPSWFKPLVNKVIQEGDDVTKKWATQERQIVHTTKLPDSQTDVLVTQDLNTGDVLVDIGVEKHGFASGKFGQPVRLEYKASEEIKPVINSWTGKVDTKGKKTPEEFNVEEAEFTGGHPENVKFEESTINKFGDHASDFSEVESFATGKSIKEIQKTKRFTKDVNRDVSDVDWKPTDDYASGGRVPMWLGGGLSKGKRTLSELLKYMSKGSSHGKTPSQMLYMINPKQFNQMLNNPGGIPSIAKEMIEKYTKEMKIDRADMVEHLIGTGKKIKKVDDDIAKYKMKIIEDIMSKGTTDRATAEQMAETILMMVKQGAKKRPTPKITDQGLLEMENIQKNLATKDRKLNASGGRVPLSKGGGLFNLLKTIFKKPSKKSYERVDLEKLLRGKDKIPVYSGSMDRQSNTWKSFVEDAEKLGTTPEKIAKDKFKGQWFTPFRSYAESFSNPKDLTSKMRTVDLTPEEIKLAKRYVQKVNKKDIISMRKKHGIKPYPKHMITTDENLVLIPRYKLKKLKKENRIMTDYLIKDKIKSKLGLAEGGVAGMLGE